MWGLGMNEMIYNIYIFVQIFYTNIDIDTPLFIIIIVIQLTIVVYLLFNIVTLLISVVNSRSKKEWSMNIVTFF